MRRIVLAILILFMPVLAQAKMQQTLWHPDTCDGCSVVYEWDDSLPQDQRVHVPVEVSNEHIDFKNDSKQVKYDKILEENQRKNFAIGEVIKNNPMVAPDSIGFAYDSKHKLHLSVPGLTTQEKINAQGTVDAKIGSNKVILE